jgi:hypothetical protein
MTIRVDRANNDFWIAAQPAVYSPGAKWDDRELAIFLRIGESPKRTAVLTPWVLRYDVISWMRLNAVVACRRCGYDLRASPVIQFQALSQNIESSSKPVSEVCPKSRICCRPIRLFGHTSETGLGSYGRAYADVLVNLVILPSLIHSTT